jgi:arylsulfatase A-like enzyme
MLKKLTRRELLKYGLYGGLAAGLSPGLLLGGCEKAKNKRPNIILITLDTTRADHLSFYGYHRRTSPNLAELVDESVVYTNAIAPSSWTLPSHASLFTGKFTASHGAQYDPDGPLRISDAISGPEAWQNYRARGLAQNEVTLAGILKEAGYSTGAVVGGPWMKKIFGLNKGFDFYDDREIGTVNGRLAGQISASASQWIDKLRGDDFFLFLNYFDPHTPYQAPEGFSRAFLPKSTDLSGRKPTLEEYIALYDSEILYMDHYIGLLLSKLKADNLYDETMIIVTADHGELFGEHGHFGHGKHLYQEEIHVPLFIKYPGGEVLPSRTDVQVQLNDIMAIILERLGIPIPQGIQAGVPPQIGHPLLSEVSSLPAFSPYGAWRAIFGGDFKFTWNSKGNNLLFNLKDDPRENKNLVNDKPGLAKRMMSDLNQYLEKLPEPGPASEAQDLDEDTKKALRSLGYIE